MTEPTREDLIARVEKLERCLRAILDAAPREICYDEFAYKRMLNSYRKAAIEGLKKSHGADS